MIQWERLSQQLDLGAVLSLPKPLEGGLTHKMYLLSTTKGKYAVKWLNPHIMKRETALENYRIAEQLEEKLEQRCLPILPALSFYGRKMQEIEGKYFYIYEWYPGKVLKSREITAAHCRRMGGLLAEIHSIDQQKTPFFRQEIHIHWDFYLQEMALRQKELFLLLSQAHPLLLEIQKRGNLAISKVPPLASICHNDMDPKNVLWKGKDCRIIDLECLSYANPFLELCETALCWSGYEECAVDRRLLQEWIQSYQQAGGLLPSDWEPIYDSCYGRLEWLEYNMKRALGIDCAPEEQEIGISQVKKTTAVLTYYGQKRDAILHCLKQQRA